MQQEFQKCRTYKVKGYISLPTIVSADFRISTADRIYSHQQYMLPTFTGPGGMAWHAIYQSIFTVLYYNDTQLELPIPDRARPLQ